MHGEPGKLLRKIFSTKNMVMSPNIGTSLVMMPGTVIRREGSKAKGGKTVTEAYDYSGSTYNFLKDMFNRNSIDTRGMNLDSTVHYGENYNNAFWNGTQMVYGDGDGDDQFLERIALNRKLYLVVGREWD